MTVQDGIVLRGECIVIPSSMRKSIKEKVHAGHLGINSSLRRAREIIFWPGMSADIRQHVERCPVCMAYSDKQPAEPLVMRDVPERPFSVVATDIFTLSGRDYLVLVDTYSTFIEVDYLKTTTSDEVITKLKSHFARYGCPDMVISDNGPHYASAAFSQFAKEWKFQHQTSFPGDSQSNGAAEAAVKVIKRLMRKCVANREDPYIGLLNLRNTPTEGLETSPVQRLMGRRTNSLLPATSAALQPEKPVDERTKMENKKMKAAERHLYRRTLAPLQVGDTIRLQPIRPNEREWKTATVSKHLDGKGFEVTTEGGQVLRRSRKQMRKDKSVAPSTPDTTPTKAPMALPTQSTETSDVITPTLEENSITPKHQSVNAGPSEYRTTVNTPQAPVTTPRVPHLVTTPQRCATRSGRVSAPLRRYREEY